MTRRKELPGFELNSTAIGSPGLMSARAHCWPPRVIFVSDRMVKLTRRRPLPPWVFSFFTLTLLAAKLATTPRNGLEILSAAFGSVAQPAPACGSRTTHSNASAPVHATTVDVFICVLR